MNGNPIHSYDKGLISATIAIGEFAFTAVSLHVFPFHLFGDDASDSDFRMFWSDLSARLAYLAARPLVALGDFNTPDRNLVLVPAGLTLKRAVIDKPTYNSESLDDLINVAVSEGHERIPEEEEFLAAIANSLANLIERHQTETDKNRLREQLAETEKLAALGRITANVSHTIKNPLTAIGGFANRLMDKLPEGTKEKKYAGLIFTEAVRLENVLQNVLLFSRHDADRQEDCSIPEIVEKALMMYEEICREKLIAIKRDFKNVPLVTGNKEQLFQAIENLLSNAIDAMVRGGSLTVGTDVEKKGESSFVRLTIRDTGYGIEAENINRIFEPFFTTKLLLKGTGLGLSITKKVVDDHGGFIRVDSRVGIGTTFDVLFPIKRT